jgi:uncharacterized protein YjbI with pentapeptide repeats
VPPSKPPTKPDPPDIPAELERAEAGLRLAGGIDLEGALVEAADFSGQAGSSIRFDESRLSRVDFSGAEIIAASFNDVVISGGSWANVRTKDLRMRRVAFKGVRMTGADLAYATLDDVSFIDCRLDLAFFVDAKLNRVRFEKCRLDELDFTDCNLSSVAFEDCSLPRSVWTEAFLVNCEMRGSDISGAAHLERLRGVRMLADDILGAAQDFALALGIETIE